MRAHRVYGSRSVTIVGVMMMAALFPYVCCGTMLTPDNLPGTTSHQGAVSRAVGTSATSVIATEHEAGRCAASNSCCSTPAKQKSRYSPKAPALCGQIDIVPAPPAETSVAVLHTTPEGLPAFPPGTSAPLIC